MAENTSHTGAPGNPVNEALSKAVSNFSKFLLHRRRFQTMHFGLIEPHCVIEGVTTDVLPLQSTHNLRSYTLSNVLMSDIKMHKEYFSVNRDAILPKNWQKVFENPTYGDDVLSDVNSFIPYRKLATHLINLVDSLLDTYTMDDWQTAFDLSVAPKLLRPLFLLESFCGNGCLLHTLGVALGGLVLKNLYLPAKLRDDEANVVDYLIDIICGYISRYDAKFTLLSVETGAPERVYSIRHNATFSDQNSITWRDAFMIMRECPFFTLQGQVFQDGAWVDEDIDISGVFHIETDPGFDISNVFESLQVINTTSSEGLNFARVVAYQLVCAHYFTNDHVDYVYSAQLFEQAESSLYQIARNLNADGTMEYFSYNGLQCLFDTFSGHVFDYMLGLACSVSISFDDGTAAAAAYISNLLSFRRSLRYRDYFIGAKPTPLALGDTNVAVNNNLVSIIDTTKGIAAQRFLNQVNRIGRRIQDYLKGLYPGAKVEKDIYEPTWLARSDHDVKAVENENTANEQYELSSSVTSVLRSSDSRYIFECEVGRPSIIIGITYYDVPRAYAYSIDKNTMEADRFDMFIPQMQFIGDQPILLTELGRFPNSVVGDETFAYTLRDMQYKQLFDIAIGGFVDKLPGWCFLSPRAGDSYHISPDVIRSFPSELDRFYLRLDGYSLGSYWHFILLIDNTIDAKRPMVYAPSIL